MDGWNRRPRPAISTGRDGHPGDRTGRHARCWGHWTGARHAEETHRNLALLRTHRQSTGLGSCPEGLRPWLPWGRWATGHIRFGDVTRGVTTEAQGAKGNSGGLDSIEVKNFCLSS